MLSSLFCSTSFVTTEMQRVGNILPNDIEELKVRLREEIKAFWGPLSVVERLKGRGYTVAVVSNHSTFWFNYFTKRYNFGDVFEPDLLLSSSEARCAKPSKFEFP